VLLLCYNRIADIFLALSSYLSIEDYHDKADRTMEGLLDTLEGLLDNSGQPDWEVDYHVRFFFYMSWS
jgi:hypothetical protein